jgi:hypothetical protein
MAVRVNAVGTDVVLRHEVVERADDGGFTIRYSEGPKRGLDVHFFGAAEIEALFEERFRRVVRLRRSATKRPALQTGSWVQWEAIWKAT